MANLRDIKKRITSVQSTRQVTRTMEMISTAKIRKAQERIEGSRPYSDAMAEMLGRVARQVSGASHPLLEVREDQKRAAVIVVGSDRGMAGGFSSAIIHMAQEYMAEKQAIGCEVELITVGRKAAGYFRYRNVELALALEGMSTNPRNTDAKAIADRVIRGYALAEYDEVVILHNRFISVGEQRPERTLLLPFSTEEVETEKVEGDKIAGEYIFEPSAEAVLERLIPSFVESRIFAALLDSAASEHAARRKAMKAATDNATEMIGTLTRSYNRARQSVVTTEIAEIVGGAAALED